MAEEYADFDPGPFEESDGCGMGPIRFVNVSQAGQRAFYESMGFKVPESTKSEPVTPVRKSWIGRLTAVLGGGA